MIADYYFFWPRGRFTVLHVDLVAYQDHYERCRSRTGDCGIRRATNEPQHFTDHIRTVLLQGELPDHVQHHQHAGALLYVPVPSTLYCFGILFTVYTVHCTVYVDIVSDLYKICMLNSQISNGSYCQKVFFIPIFWPIIPPLLDP